MESEHKPVPELWNSVRFMVFVGNGRLLLTILTPAAY